MCVLRLFSYVMFKHIIWRWYLFIRHTCELHKYTQGNALLYAFALSSVSSSHDFCSSIFFPPTTLIKVNREIEVKKGTKLFTLGEVKMAKVWRFLQTFMRNETPHKINKTGWNGETKLSFIAFLGGQWREGTNVETFMESLSLSFYFYYGRLLLRVAECWVGLGRPTDRSDLGYWLESCGIICLTNLD